PLCMEAEGPIVKGFDVIDLQRAVPFVQISHFGSALKVVDYFALAIMEDNASCLFGPDATTQRDTVFVLEAAGNHHTGVCQGAEPEGDL
uniref:Uncharacterized protein n=1 Tax=Stegastes partitus TaxID=144197 RepID=A0A3B5APB1_9TELE